MVPLRWLLVRDPAGRFKSQALLATEPDTAPADMLAWFIRRWSIEVTFGEVRRHLGVESQRQWTDRAIARTTPMLLGLFSLVALFADDIQRTDTIVARAARWYNKTTVTFSDALAVVRRQIWVDESFVTSRSGRDPHEGRPTVLDRLVDLACYAA